MSSAVRLAGATKRFASRAGILTAIRDVDLDVARGEFVCLVGPTGCGKSTALGLIAGLQRPSSGTVSVDDRVVDGIPAGVGFMFQTDAMLPWRTVAANVAAGLRWSGASRAEAKARTEDWLHRVGLSRFGDYYLHQLSGGMRKRVALAQTLIMEPSILLMDEPFSALDVQTRSLMQQELLQLWSGSDAAVVFVTHDLEEAVLLGDRVVVMTSSPARVKDEFRVDIPRPRDVEELRTDPAFVRIYREIWASLSAEVENARREAGHVA
jgi:NitT/TauT family transport system ATP-binding protein